MGKAIIIDASSGIKRVRVKTLSIGKDRLA